MYSELIHTNNSASTVDTYYTNSNSNTTYYNAPAAITWTNHHRFDITARDELRLQIRKVFSGHSYAPKGLIKDGESDFYWHYDKAYAAVSTIRKLQNKTDQRAFDGVMRRKYNLRWEKQSVNKKLTVRHKGRSASRSWMTGRPRR